MTESYRHLIGTGFFFVLGCAAYAASPRDSAPAGLSSAVTTDSSRLRRSKADVEFMQGMISHHAQALTMARLVSTHTNNARLHLLAQRIDVSQRDEIKQMQRWLEDRHETVPGVGHDHDAMEHPVGMPGMLTPQQFAQLGAARGAAFDTLFLTFMISHHEGALVMVSKLFGTNGAGQDPQLFDYASDVDADQRAEIARMRVMLGAQPNETPRR